MPLRDLCCEVTARSEHRIPSKDWGKMETTVSDPDGSDYRLSLTHDYSPSENGWLIVRMTTCSRYDEYDDEWYVHAAIDWVRLQKGKPINLGGADMEMRTL